MKSSGVSLEMIVAALALALACAAPARGHIEAAELAADVVWNRTTVRLDLRLAVRELINAEQPIDSVVLPDYNQDPVEVMKRHEEEVLSAFTIHYDGIALTPRLVESSVQNLVIGVSDEDIVPRVCATYALEFSGGQNNAGPSQIDLELHMFKLPPEAGFQPTVLCMVTHQLAGSDRQRIAVIGHDETLTIRPEWPGASAESAPAPGAVVASATPTEAAAPAPRSRGPMIVLGAAAVIAAVLLVIIARKKA